MHWESINFGSKYKPKWFTILSFVKIAASMKSLTIHNIENEIAAAIEKMAHTIGLNQNKVVKKLLRKALELEEPTPEKPKRDVSAFSGVWTPEEAAAFEQSQAVFEKVEVAMWS